MIPFLKGSISKMWVCDRLYDLSTTLPSLLALVLASLTLHGRYIYPCSVDIGHVTCFGQ